MRMFIQRGRRWLAAAILATFGFASQAGAQYAGYGASPYVAPPQYMAARSQTGAAPSQYPAYSVPPQYAGQGAYQGYSQTQQTAFTQPPNYAGPYGVPYTAMAYQQAPAATPTPAAAPAETLPLTPPAESVAPGNLQGGAYVPQPTPSPENNYSGYGPGYAPSGGYESYPPVGGAGSNAGYGGYGTSCNATPYGACNTYSTYGGMDGCLSKHAGCGYWFGGVYGLLMDRDNSNKYPLVFSQTSMPVSSYPTSSPNVVLTTRDADVGFQPGVEFRLGRTFGCAPMDPCSCCSPCLPRWGLEGVYWTLFDEDDVDTYVDQATLRTYTMMPFYGLQYNNGAGYRPMNEYFDYAPPSQATTDIEIRLARVRSSLEVQNVEVNLLRLSCCGGGYGPAMYGAAYGPAAGGYAGSAYGGGGGSCDGSCSVCDGGCAPCGPKVRYCCTGVCGFRWMQFNEDFMFGVDFDNTGVAYPDPVDGSLNYWSTVENNLFGAQIGCNGVYRVGCKWGFHLVSLVGLYGNDIDVRQYFVSPTNLVSFIGTGENFDAHASKTDVSMIGELRLGASYQYSCHCSLYGGWRVLGITGIALATDQAPNTFMSAGQLANYVNSNGSMILHGLQAGVQWNY